MWKIVSKAVKDALEKGNGILYCRSINVQDHGKFEANCLKQPDLQIESSSGDNNNGHKESCKDHSFDCSQYLGRNIFKAITCSTAMALGWSLSQLLCVRDSSLKYKEYSKRSETSKCKYKNLVPYSLLLPHTVWAQPITFKTINNANQSEPSSSTLHPLPISPPTKEETRNIAIEDAAEQFAFVTGELENQLGAAYVQQSQPSVGVEHFEAGALYRNASAAFNLGLCYELGVGTTQNYEKAANCYQIAAELGHAKAMFNLAIYHIHGYGGLCIDFNQARLLFIEAAKKGHKESIAALSSECASILCNDSETLTSNPLDRVSPIPILNSF